VLNIVVKGVAVCDALKGKLGGERDQLGQARM
jgi:hypothetical protein